MRVTFTHVRGLFASLNVPLPVLVIVTSLCCVTVVPQNSISAAAFSKSTETFKKILPVPLVI